MGLAVGAHPKKILNEGDVKDLVAKIRELHASNKLYAIGEVGKYLPWKHSLVTCFVNILNDDTDDCTLGCMKQSF